MFPSADTTVTYSQIRLNQQLFTESRVPKNGVLRSKRLPKPQPLPHQHWGLEFRTTLR